MNKKTKKVWITAYDVPSATASLEVGVDGILVGDSLGMTVYGLDSTKEVTVEMMSRHFEVVGHLRLTPQTLELQARTEQNELLETIQIFDDIGVKIGFN